MNHQHYTDIDHGHTVHNKQMSVNMTMNMFSDAGSSNAELSMTGVRNDSYGVYNVGYLYGYSNVTVDGTGTLLKDSSFAGAWDANHNWVSYPNTSNWGSANPTAINIVPKYQAVYTWYRES